MYRIEETFIIYSKKKALTLIEMVIVIIIIGILASAIIPIVNGIQARVRDTARSAYMRDLSSALEVFQMDTRSYPIISTWILFSWNVEMLSWILQSYIKNIPRDPNKMWLYVINPSWNCKAWWDYFSYYTDYKWSMFAITSMKESNKWNTSNCEGLVDQKQWKYEVIWMWITNYEFIYDWLTSPINWCEQNLTQSEADELNSIDGTSNTISQRCAKTTVYRQNKGITKLPKWLQKIINLEYLRLDNNPINTLSLSSSMPRLKHLYVPTPGTLTSILLPTYMPSLTNLNIENNRLSLLPEFTRYPLLSYYNFSSSPKINYLTPIYCQYIASRSIRWYVSNSTTLCSWY